MKNLSNKFIVWLIIILTIIAIIFVIKLNKNKESQEKSYLLANELMKNENYYIQVNQLDIDNLTVDKFQFSDIGVLQINDMPMLHFIVTNNKNEKAENCNFRIDVYDKNEKLIDEKYVSLSDFGPNEKKEISVKLNVDEKLVKSVKIKSYENSAIYMIN